MMEPEVVLSRRGRLGKILLNRPKALNALTHGMSLAIEAALREWAGDERVAAVIIRQAGERAFCAGGDVRQFPEKGAAFMHRYWRDEYRLNALIRRYPKPYIAFVDGIVMGGGIGVSVHGTHRIVSEHLSFAMPETAIGLVPDVGASYVLPRMPGEIGLYLGLTGARLGAADAMAWEDAAQRLAEDCVDREPYLVRISAAKRLRDRAERDARLAGETSVTAERVADARAPCRHHRLEDGNQQRQDQREVSELDYHAMLPLPLDLIGS